MTPTKRISGIYNSMRRIYTLRYLALNVAIAAAYYLIIRYILAVQEFGISLSTVPIYLLYLLAFTSSALMTVAVYILINGTTRANSYTGSASSAATALAGGVLGGCGCHAAIMYAALAVFLGSGEAVSINTALANNVGALFGALCIINLALFVYYLDNISRGGCKVRRK